VSRPAISIVVPTFNRAALLKACLDSLLQQDYQNWECVLVDDGSTDNTAELYSVHPDERIRYFHKENAERNLARNFGASKATGEWLIFLDSDDRFHSDHLSGLAKYFDLNKEAEFVICPYSKRNELGVVLEEQAMNIGSQLIEKLAFQNFIPPSAVAIRRTMFDNIQFINSKTMLVGEDLLLWLKVLSRTRAFVFNQNSVDILVHKGQSMQLPQVQVILQSLDELVNELKADTAFSQQHATLIPEIRASYYSLASLSAVMLNRKKEATRLIRKAFRSGQKEWRRKRNFAILKRLIFS
jgi:glycosyltransferase involved in cell wall biosynthesis